MHETESWRDFVSQDDHWESRLILSYAPCKVYTAALFDDLMAFKALSRRIKHMSNNPSEYRKRQKMMKATNASSSVFSSKDTGLSPMAVNLDTPKSPVIDFARPKLDTVPKVSRGSTFGLNDPDNPVSWSLGDIDSAHEPLSMDLETLKKASLVCRAASTLITEEAARLVDHPHLAYAEFDDRTHRIRINMPNYPAPEFLEQRLPVFVGDDASGDVMSNDEAVTHTLRHQRNDELYFSVVGDLPNPHRNYKAFSTLDVSEPYARGGRKAENRVARVSLHAHRHSWWRMSTFSHDSHMAIGGIGLRFAKPTTKKPLSLSHDKCNVHLGERPGKEDRFISVQDFDTSDKGDAEGVRQLEISYVPGTGRIAGLTFYEGKGGEMDAAKALPSLYWRQWEKDDGNDGREPEGLKKIIQGPPTDGDRWRFVGLCGHWDTGFRSGRVLARVSGIWRRVSEA